MQFDPDFSDFGLFIMKIYSAATRSFLSFLIIAAHPWVCFAEQKQDSLVQNSSFEEAASNGKPVAWSLSGSAVMDESAPQTGRICLKMENGESVASSANQRITCQQRHYLLVGWIKTDGVAGTGARIRLWGMSGQLIEESKGLTGTNGWQKVSIPFNPGSNETVTIELSLSGAAGRAWFDEIRVEGATNEKQAAQDGGMPHENIALGKSYELSPPPNYKPCVDSSDAMKLTNGRYAERRFWADKLATVGWERVQPQIIVDLGRVEPIESIMIHSVGGGQVGVWFPLSITYLVSDDNEHFHEVAVVTSQDLIQDKQTWYTKHFRADGLKTRGRYVMIRPVMGASTFYADEVEIRRGDFDPAPIRFEAKAQTRQEIAFAALGMVPGTYRRGHFPETPHVKWATPLSGGPIKAIVVNFDDDMRETVELAQRLDLDYVPISNYSFYTPKPLPSLMGEQLSKALPTAQVMIVGGLRWGTLDRELIRKIKTRVREGMGLICVADSRKDDWIKPVAEMFNEHPLEGEQRVLDLVPMSLIPGYHKPSREKPHAHLALYGEGRVCLLDPKEFTRDGKSLLPRFTLADMVDQTNGPLEYYFSAMSKLISWAAKRDTQRLAQITASPEAVSVTVQPGEAAAKVKVVVRDTFFSPVETLEKAVSTAGGRLEFKLPASTNGIHPVDVWLCDEAGGIIDFGSAYFKGENSARMTGIEIAKPFFAPGEAIDAKVRVTGALDGLQLRARLLDTYDREVAPMQTISAAEGENRIQFSYPRPLALAARLAIELVRGDTVLEKRIDRIWVDVPVKDDFTVCGWYALNYHPSAQYCVEMLRKLGLDIFVSGPGKARAENAAYGNLRYGPEDVATVRPPKVNNGSLVREPCLSDPSYRATVGERIKTLARECRPFGTLEWSMGDEERLGSADYCVSPTCLVGLRDYLRYSYPSLDALNESWGSHFKTWEEIVPSTLEQVSKQEKIASWLDHRRYMESLFAEYHDWCRKLIVEEIPSARVGLSGSQEPNSYNGYDWAKLLGGPVTHVSGYRGIQSALQRSFLQPGSFFTTFLGYDYTDANEQRARHQPWSFLFNGANGLNYYTLVSNTLNCPLIRPDLSLTRKAEWFFEEARELKAGLGRLFMSGKYENDGIAIHYSPPSIHTATATGLLTPGETRRNFTTNLMNLGMILSESHYQFDFIHEGQMAEGALAKYKVLILPWSSAISPGEATAIRKFVENGGTVIADTYCGVRDDHGKPQAMLDDLFGIRQSLTPPAITPTELIISDPNFNGPKNIHVASGSGDIALHGGKALASIGKAPALILHKLGKGRAIFLNASFANYAEVQAGGVGGEVQVGSVASQGTTGPIRGLMTTLLTDAGVPVPMPVICEGESDSEFELSRFSLGSSQLVGLIRGRQVGGVPSFANSGAIDRKDLIACEVDFQIPAHVYESRSGRYLGKVAKVKESIPRAIARVYALLPYKVNSVAITGTSQVAPGEAANVQLGILADGKVGIHVFHLSIKGPDGVERAYYAENVIGNGGKASATIPFAYNDPEGEWTVTAKDIATGMTNSFPITLKSK